MIKFLKSKIMLVIKIFMELKLWAKIALCFIVIGGFMYGSIKATSTPGFCNSCHIMNPYYDNWKESAHSDVSCVYCHLKPGFFNYMKGKINGLAQSVDCVVGRFGTKPTAKIEDVSCMRHDCHSSEQLSAKTVDFNGIKFDHAKHISKTVDGMSITCGVCHSHFEGDEHFDVNKQSCFTCHFLNNTETDKKVVQTECLSCHEVPDKVIKRGLVTVNHAEFVTYEATCDKSCHQGQIEHQSSISPTVCLSCHTFTMDNYKDKLEHTDFDTHDKSESEILHMLHTTAREKVECFDCHGTVPHGPTKSSTVAGMMNCKNCHSDTHNIQFNIYSASNTLEHKSDRILGPMFLTHVKCQGCHIERQAKETGPLASVGTVAKANSKACDNCHEPGTGQKYVPFWQKTTKKLHKKIADRIKNIENIKLLRLDKKAAQKMRQKIADAKEILDAVESDGSWGVHNLKYTEAMLIKANDILNEDN